MGLEIFEDGVLQALIFGHRLDHQITLGESRVIGGGGEVEAGIFPILGGHAAAINPALHVAFDHFQRVVQGVLADISQHHRKAGGGKDLGDATAHLATTDHPHAADFRRRGRRLRREYEFRHFVCNAAVSSGTTAKRSPTRP